jgi:pimeloyl-ACP methyl ester carboxylesterase
MWSKISGLLLAISLSCPLGAAGEVLVLVHGYLGSAQDWHNSGFTTELIRAGWSDAGTLAARPTGVQHQGRGMVGGGRSMYTAQLPSEMPLQVQAGLLAEIVYWVHDHHPGEHLTLVGHSAGGVVARLAMVQQPQTRVGTLVTFASPHLGTAGAELGMLAGQSPLIALAPLLGLDTVGRSQALYEDLIPERPGTLLHWLNRRSHPTAIYLSVVRPMHPAGLQGDFLIPSDSQDMRNVKALRDIAQRHLVPGGHQLSGADGRWLAGALGDPGI